ncbi:hypothetical protein [Robertkochia sediminum]|uniref:hypothetical protein n=1 Tax=Robertkochia sediminum TaxID=2785326 RepID=UPI0019321D6A|nr:hypothetical protein [Robertkochia sediminum]MBL7473093.1 hypothetical protein [Robertkochia sediminum]
MTDSNSNDWVDYRKELIQNKSKSDDDFEKYITFIASGGLGLTLSFVGNIVPLSEAISIWAILLGWFLLAFTLFVNLVSHYLSGSFSYKTIQDIDDVKSFDIIMENIDNRNKIISCLNLISIILLGLGILMILIFVSLNLSL